ncbi:hypothetical protein Leryth_010192 [Lithospermum erythrorhizon]|uniref:Uncharacterized protein n=1 Tax=Lithospermum erythrorhizon TaxID=34254 RepID=A0AAV3PPQ0_LITER|nr:hypothetical protein Leryth_010192 [Lithospermum erythrorhizon]
MASTFSISSPILIQKPSNISKNNPVISRLLVIRASKGHVTTSNCTSLQIRSSPMIKVFEDRSKGIICYRDASGEITCEGYDDEGPRLHQQHSRITCDFRDMTEVVDLFQSWIQRVDGAEYSHGVLGLNGQMDN